MTRTESKAIIQETFEENTSGLVEDEIDEASSLAADRLVNVIDGAHDDRPAIEGDREQAYR